ncbi:hypothetical protein MWN34_01360 [Ancylobacter sp. 6x-1]|uniref:Uncharacterized protein n=1 Tax=Ancylobacter crimeensis TaxID=2579147 RepID=A0ABT0D6J2_9HYPH|nr:hypothetical protein [Ancylobacter crimeensis]MCK0195554.1 hypothetical protein [Ancylobacter crimeensis]
MRPRNPTNYARLRKLPPQRAVALDSLPDAAFRVPRAFIEAEKVFRKVAVSRKDRKAHEDTERPRIARTLDGLSPCRSW